MPTACNVVPLNFFPGEGGYTAEELKLRNQSCKILAIPGLPVSGTCVRVPVYTGHSLSINAEVEGAISVAEATEILKAAPGLVGADVSNPLGAAGRNPV